MYDLFFDKGDLCDVTDPVETFVLCVMCGPSEPYYLCVIHDPVETCDICVMHGPSDTCYLCVIHDQVEKCDICVMLFSHVYLKKKIKEPNWHVHPAQPRVA